MSLQNTLEDYLRSVIAADAPRPGIGAAALRAVLGGCAGLYDIGLEAYLAAERLGLRRRARLPLPIVSIGNLTVGGTGKTPLTQMLCRRLSEQGKRVAVLSRGHGGSGAGVQLVSDAQGDVLLMAGEAGDEPALLARTLPGIPILTGKDRRQSGRAAMRRFTLDVLVLDDGFQYWQLARDLDIVLLDAASPFDNGFPLPRGLLREPARHLRRAGIVVVTRADRLDASGRELLWHQIAALAPGAEIFFATHRPVGLTALADGSRVPLATLKGRPILALSGIAQPQSFAETLTQATDAGILHHLVYADHARYDEADVRTAARVASDLGVEALVMTEKDAVKWPQSLWPTGLPVFALQIEMRIEDEPRFLAAVNQRLFPSER